MIEIVIRNHEFAYDVKALTLSFFPEQECSVTEDETAAEGEGYYLCCSMDGEIFLEKMIAEPYDKNKVKQVLYDTYSAMTKKELPWGILTGIRPAKIALRAMLAGKDEEEIKRELKDVYRMKEDKIHLATLVAKTEKKLMEDIDCKNGYSVYIGIPFCRTRCHYCSFAAYPLARYAKQVDDYLEALMKEMKFVGEKYGNHPLHSIYIGGGTPTALNEEQFERLLQAVHRYYDVSKALEFTVEAGRPDTITEEKLRLMKEYGVTRISINPQTMKQETLIKMGREHTPESIVTVFKKARELGFDNINMDLIVGLPDETMEDFKKTLDEIGALEPDSITIHTLVIKRASMLREEQDKSGGPIKEADEVVTSMQDYGERFCYEHGYLPYYMYRQKNKSGMTKNTNQENVAYAKPGKECYYNVFIMEELETIIALGAGASSKYVISDRQMERVGNVKSVEEYIKRLDEMIERKRSFTLWQ